MTSQRDTDRGWAWLVLLASYFNLFLCPGLAYVAGMFQLVFLDEFHGSVAFTSWVTALFSSLMQLAGPLSSVVSNCFTCRVAVMMGGAFMSFGLFISSMTNSLEMLFITFGVIAGIGLGLTYTASIVVINYYFVEKRTLVTGIAFSASGLGLLITPQVSQLLFENFSWRESLAILGGAAAQICVMGALMSSVHETKAQKGTVRRYCCYRTSGSRNQNNEYDYQVPTDTEDVTLTQMYPLKSIDEKTEGSNSNTENETSGINPREKCTEVTCSNSGLCKECPLHYEEKSSRVLSQASNHHFQEANVSTESIPNRFERPDPRPYFLKMKPQSPSSIPFLFGSLKEHITTSPSAKLTGSHQELSTTLLRPEIRALKGVGNTRSHQELSDRHLRPSHKSSNPHLLPRLDLARSWSVGVSHTSIEHVGLAGSHGQIVIISRSPSVMGLLPSTTPFDVIIPPEQGRQSNASLHSSSVFESRIVIAQVPPVAKATKPPDFSEDGRMGESTESAVESRTFPPLYKNICFWLLCLSLFVSNAGCGIFNIHIPGFMKGKGLTDHEVTNVLSINGFALLFGRCLCAALANSVKGNHLLIYWALHVLGGLCVCLMPTMGQGYVSLCILIYGVGSYYGTVYAVLSPITIEIVGLKSLATAFGIEMVFAGVGYFVSPPLAGSLVDLTNSYDYSMYCGGALFILGGTIILCIPLLGHTSAYVAYADVTLDDHGQEVHSDDLDSKSCSTEGCGLRNDGV